MGILCFKKESLHCIWDDCLVGKDVVVSDSLVSLFKKLEDDDVPVHNVIASPDVAYPFLASNNTVWRFAYVLGPAIDDPGDSEVKQAYLQGRSIVRRYVDGEWDCMGSTSYFDLPGYEYKVLSNTPLRVSNRVLAEWLASGKGLLLDVRSNYVKTTHIFAADDIDSEVPDGYKIMPKGYNEWFEPTDDLVL